MGKLKKLARRLADLFTEQSDERPRDHFEGLRPDMTVEEYVRRFERNAKLKEIGEKDE